MKTMLRRRELLQRTLLGGLGSLTIAGCRPPLWATPLPQACFDELPSDALRAAVIDPSGRFVVGVHGGARLRLVDLTRRQARTFVVPGGRVSKLGLANGGSWAVVAHECGPYRLSTFDFTRAQAKELRHPRAKLEHFAATRDGTRIVAAGSNGRVYAWERGRDRTWHSGKFDGILHAITISDVDGSVWVAYERDGRGGVARWAGTRGLQVVFEGIPPHSTAIAVGAQGVFVTARQDEHTALFVPHEKLGLYAAVKRLPVRAEAISLSAAGKVVVGGGTVCMDGGVAIVEEGNAKRLRAETPQFWVDDVVVRGDDTVVVAGDVIELWREDGVLRLDYDGATIPPADPGPILCG